MQDVTPRGCSPFEKNNNLKKSHDTNLIEYIRFF